MKYTKRCQRLCIFVFLFVILLLFFSSELGSNRVFAVNEHNELSDIHLDYLEKDTPPLAAESENVFYLPLVLRNHKDTNSLFESVLHLDGDDDYTASPDSVDLNVGNQANEDLTVEAWFYISDPNPYGDDPEVIACKWQSYCVYIIRRSSGDADLIIFRLWYGTNTINEWAKWLYFMTPGWHHIAGVYDNDQDEIRLYYDGNLELTGTFAKTIFRSTDDVTVGGFTKSNFFDGEIEEVRISDIPRYTGDSFTLPSNQYVCDSNTRALWHFDEPAGSTIFYDGDDGGGSACGSVEDTLTGFNGAVSGPF